MVKLSCFLVLLCGAPFGSCRSEDNDKMTYEYLPSLLRFNRNGKLVSSDIDEYLTYSCRYKNENSDAKTCSVNIDDQDFRDALDTDATDPDDESVVSYLEVSFSDSSLHL